jgi:ABC-type lipoprotein export system ATPase subunit
LMKIKAEELTRTFRVGSSEIAAVDRVSFEISEPKFIAIVGRSGSGKSTLLNLIGLNDRPTSGRILVDDADATLFSSNRRKRTRLLQMGFVFQTFNLFPTLSALENVELPLSLAGKPRELQKEKAKTLLEAIGLGKRLQHRPKQLSMGEMQRVAVARAMANNPEIIIADEPTGELDSGTAQEIITLLHSVNKRDRKTVIVATHDEKIIDVADTVYTIQDGKMKLES